MAENHPNQKKWKQTLITLTQSIETECTDVEHKCMSNYENKKWRIIHSNTVQEFTKTL